MQDRKLRNIDEQSKDGKAPGFTIPLTIKNAKLNDTVVFECLPYGKPFPDIKWLKDGIEIIPNNEIQFDSKQDGTQTLTLENVKFISEGYFRCVATNTHGTASTKAELKVHGNLLVFNKHKIIIVSGNRQPKTEDISSFEPENSKPKIRPGLYDQSVHLGSNVEMQITATGWPTPIVKWYKKEKELESEGPDGRVIIWTDERGIHHLIILNTNLEDASEYSVVATNTLGEARSVGNLNVIQLRNYNNNDQNDHHGMPFPPGFIRQLKNKHVFTHMPTVFDCLVVGYPPPDVEW